jgi:hypothetical protein
MLCALFFDYIDGPHRLFLLGQRYGADVDCKPDGVTCRFELLRERLQEILVAKLLDIAYGFYASDGKGAASKKVWCGPSIREPEEAQEGSVGVTLRHPIGVEETQQVCIGDRILLEKLLDVLLVTTETPLFRARSHAVSLKNWLLATHREKSTFG